jgi:hypothetical protein
MCESLGGPGEEVCVGKKPVRIEREVCDGNKPVRTKGKSL